MCRRARTVSHLRAVGSSDLPIAQLRRTSGQVLDSAEVGVLLVESIASRSWVGDQQLAVELEVVLFVPIRGSPEPSGALDTTHVQRPAKPVLGAPRQGAVGELHVRGETPGARRNLELVGVDRTSGEWLELHGFRSLDDRAVSGLWLSVEQVRVDTRRERARGYEGSQHDQPSVCGERHARRVSASRRRMREKSSSDAASYDGEMTTRGEFAEMLRRLPLTQLGRRLRMA